MNKYTKIFLLITVIICILGCILFGIGLATGGREFFARTNYNGTSDSSLYNKYGMEKTKLEDFSNIDIDCEDMDVEILPSEDDSFYLSYSLYSNMKKDPFQYSIKDDTLTISEKNTAKIGTFVTVDYGFLVKLFSHSFKQMKENNNLLTLYIPSDKILEDTDINLGSEDLTVDAFHTNRLVLHLSYGDLIMKNAAVESGDFSLDSGDFSITQLAANDLSLSSSYGDTEIKSSDIKQFSAQLDDGDFSAEQLNSDNFNFISSYGDLELNNSSIQQLYVKSDDGDLNMENTTILGQAELSIDYGDADIELSKEQRNTLQLLLQTDYGDITAPSSFGGKLSVYADGDSNQYERIGADENICLTVHCSDGDITIS